MTWFLTLSIESLVQELFNQFFYLQYLFSIAITYISAIILIDNFGFREYKLKTDLYLFQTLLEEASSANLLRSDMTPSIRITEETGSTSNNCFGACELDSSKFASMEAEIAVNFLRKAQSEVLNSFSAAPQYGKLMDEILNFVMEELKTLPEERDRIAQEVSTKNRMLFLCFLLWIVGVSAVIFFTSDINCSFSGPLPT